MSRPSLDEYFISMLKLVASRSTCIRRSVGCIITDEKGHILSTGYNGVPSGSEHCKSDSPITVCEGGFDKPGDSTRCLAIHAEQNAIMQAGDRLRLATTVYCSCLPCFGCAKMLCNIPLLTRIVVLETYADEQGMMLFHNRGIQVDFKSAN